MADTLEAVILHLGPETVLAFLSETVAGASLGAVPPAPDYLKRIRQICDRYGVLLILDEVMCGMGRTGHLYACAEDGVSPDILCIAQGFIYKAIEQGSGAFQHGNSYVGHPIACAAGVAVLTAIRDRGLFRGVELVEDRATKAAFPTDRRLRARLKALAMDEGLICHPFGGSVDGVQGDHIFLAPPFIIEDAQIDELVEKLSRALRRALAA